MKSIKIEEWIVDDEMQSRALWLLLKYTSLTYIKRIQELYVPFVRGYEEHAAVMSRKPERAPWHRETVRSFYYYAAALEEGVRLLSEGYVAGYARVQQGVGLLHEIDSPRYEFKTLFENIGYRAPPEESIGLFAWAERAHRMAARTWMTLEARWAFPWILDRRHEPFGWPVQLPAVPAPSGAAVRTEDEVPFSGIWMPEMVGGCPNYLKAGSNAPMTRRPIGRYEEPDDEGNWDYEYESHPTRWTLLWEDRRYQGGVVPDESQFLDEKTDFPPYPPHP